MSTERGTPGTLSSGVNLSGCDMMVLMPSPTAAGLAVGLGACSVTALCMMLPDGGAAGPGACSVTALCMRVHDGSRSLVVSCCSVQVLIF